MGQNPNAVPSCHDLRVWLKDGTVLILLEDIFSSEEALYLESRINCFLNNKQKTETLPLAA